MARLPATVAGAVLTYADERLARNPARLSKPLSGDLDGLRSARNGDYRILRELDEDASTITVIQVDHRAHVYRKS